MLLSLRHAVVFRCCRADAALIRRDYYAMLSLLRRLAVVCRRHADAMRCRCYARAAMLLFCCLRYAAMPCRLFRDTSDIDAYYASLPPRDDAAAALRL